MPRPSSATSPLPSDGVHFDRILLFGGSGRTLDLLRLATIRSDDVTLISDGELAAPVRRFADTFAVSLRRRARPVDLARAASVLVAMGDVAAENAVVRRARAAGTPVHVADRPLVSDFTLLDFLERRASTLRRASPPAGTPTILPNKDILHAD